MREIWMMQPRFEKRAGKSPYRLIELPRFRAGYDFLLLRAQSGEIDMEIADWWDDFQNADHDRREALLIPDSGPKKRRRRVRGKKPAGEGESAGQAGSDV